jgi:hypothetical protein
MDYPLVECPSCHKTQVDMDGFGVLHCSCGYCTHPAIADDVCEVCGEVVEDDYGTRPNFERLLEAE